VDPKVDLEDVEKRKVYTLKELELRNPSGVQPIASRYTD
jgi:hypothetical protein